jgi:hypothetical protein
MDEVNRRRRELAERHKKVYRRQEELVGASRNKKENRAILKKRREDFKKAHKNFSAGHLAKSLRADYTKRQKKYWKPENVRHRVAKKGSRRTRKRRAKRIGNRIDRINHEVLHGFNWL